MLSLFTKIWLVLSLVAGQLAEPSPSILGISTDPEQLNYSRQGSIYGGTKLHIRGSNFNTQDPTANYVIVGGQVCEIVQFFAGESYIQCLTPAAADPANPGSVSIQVWVNGKTVTRCSGCDFEYQSSRTPMIHTMIPTQATPESELAYRGVLRGTTQDHYNYGKIGEETVEIPDVNDILLPGVSVPYSSSGTFNVSTIIGEDNVSGDGNPVLIVDENYGTAGFEWTADTYDLDGTAYKFKIVGDIKSISEATGSAEGGHLITITGNGFLSDTSKIAANVNGNACIVEEASAHEIKCRTSENLTTTHASAPYPGGSGLRRHLWGDISGNTVDNIAGYLDSDAHIADIVATGSTNNGRGATYKQKMTGLFLAPRTGDYTFYVTSDDASRVWLSTDSDPANVGDPLIDLTSWTSYRNAMLLYEGNKSDAPRTLTAGNFYYIEIHHAQGSSSDHFTLGVSVPHGGGDYANKLFEVQKISIVPVIIREIQEVEVSGAISGGTLRFVFDGELSDDITWPDDGSIPSCGTVTSALNGTGSLGCTSETKDGGAVYTITFNSPTSQNRALITPITASLTAFGVTRKTTRTQEASPELDGTWTITFDGITTDPFNHNAWASTIEDELNEKITSQDGKFLVEGWGNGDGAYYYVIFGKREGDVSMLSATSVDLMGGDDGSPAISVEEILAGSDDQFWWEIPNEFLYTTETATQLQLTLDGSPAVCSGDCTYAYEAAPSMTITGLVNSSTLTFTGTGFAGTPTITVGGAECTSPVVSPTQITCGKPFSPVGSHQPVVDFAGYGYVAYDPSVTTTIDANLSVTGISPSFGSVAGNTTITLTGSGFLPSITSGTMDSSGSGEDAMKVTIAGNICTIQTVSATEITCKTAAGSHGDNTTIVEVTYKSTVSTENSSLFALSNSSTPTVDSISPTFASPITKTVLTLTGTNFDSTKENNTVTLEWVSQADNDSHNRDSWPCYVTAATSTEITCTLPGGRAGTYNGVYTENDLKFMVTVNDGDALFNGTLDIALELTEVSPTTGSPQGGTLITLKGTGFSETFTSNTILLGTDDAICTVESVTVSPTRGESIITCRSPPKPADWAGEDTVYILGRIQMEGTSCELCKWNYNDDSVTATVSSMSANNGKAGDTITITGTNFGTSLSDTTVSFGGEDGTVTSVTDTEIQVTVPEHREESDTAVVITIDNIGYADVASNTFTYDSAITGLTPDAGSKGGQDITVTGSGFHAGYTTTNADGESETHDQITISFGGIPCTITGVISTNQVTCRVGENTGNEDLRRGFVQKQVHTVQDDGVVTSTISLFSCPEDDVTCSFNFQDSQTPTVTSVSPSSLNSAGTLTIVGTGFSTNTSDNTVTIGSAACAVQTASATQLTCTVTPVAGTNSVDLNVAGNGYAPQGETVSSNMLLGSASPNVGSFAGGNEVTISGSNFSDDVQVDICGSTCQYVSHTNTEYICKTPLMLTEYSYDEGLNDHVKQGNGVTSYSTEITNIGSTALSTTYSLDNAFDGDTNTYYKASVGDDCYVGFDAGQYFYYILEAFQFYPEIDTDSMDLAVGIILEGSDNNSTWTTIYTFSSILAGWNRYRPEATDTIKYRYYRLKNANGVASSWLVAEIQYEGARVRSGSSTSISCDIQVSSASGSSLATKTSAYTYNVNNTPTVTAIDTYYGLVAGGTTITLTGTNFDTTAGDITVTVSGVAATVDTCTDTEITFTTGAQTAYTADTLVITHASEGYFNTKGFYYIYGYLWSEESTWGGETPPLDGQSVHIPTGMNLLYDLPPDETPLLQLVTIEGSLIFTDDFDQTFEAYYVFVRQGKLTIGTELNPRVNKLEITMHGDRWNTPEIPTYGNKVIAVREGEIDIHGTERSVVWTVLTATAAVGDTTIVVENAGDWVIGDEIVLASSDFDHNQAEVHTISNVSGNTITLSTALNFRHFGEIETYGSETVDMRCEVGLLTRNIKIHGSGTYDANPERHGAHIFVFSPGDETSVGRIENLELYNAGQAFALGRYPIHFHMIGNVRQSYIKKCAIYNTFNRAVTIHGVHHLTIMNNVAYNNMGHTFFVEDGFETHNHLEGNVAFSTQRSWSLLMTDQTPASFWITNPSNKFINNRACGSARYGFWFDFPDSGKPGGPSAALGAHMCIHGMELGEWTDNVVHSNGRYGLRIFHVLIPLANPCLSYYDSSAADPWSTNPPVTANFNGLIGYKNIRDAATAERIGDVRWNNFKAVDNKFAALEMTYAQYSKPWATVGIFNALVVGYSNNNQSLDTASHTPNNPGAFGIITSQTDGMLVDNIKFVNIGADQYPFATESHSENDCSRDWGGRIHNISNITWMDVSPNKKVYWKTPKRDVLKLVDSTYSGAPGYLATVLPHLISDDCIDETDTYNSILCNNNVVIKRVMFYNQTPWNDFYFKNVNVRRTSGTGHLMQDVEVEDPNNSTLTITVQEITPTALVMTKNQQHHDIGQSWAVPFLMHQAYEIWWGDNTVDWETMTMRIHEYTTTDWLKLSFPFIEHRDHFTVERGTATACDNSTETCPREIENNMCDHTEDFSAFNFDSSIGNSLANVGYYGDYSYDNSTDVRLFEMIVNGKVQDAVRTGDTVVVNAHKCWGNCEETLEEIGVAEVEVETIWSDNYIWTNECRFPFESGQEGPPQTGDLVQVLAGWNMTLDMDTEILDYLEINGILIFDPTKDVTLRAKRIFIRDGQLISGSPENPTTFKHTIELYGDVSESHHIFDGNIQAGNKVLANTGLLDLNGSPKASWVRLASNAHPDDTMIFAEDVTQDGVMGWAIGDKLTITSSSFSRTEYEDVEIASVSIVDQAFDSDYQNALLRDPSGMGYGKGGAADAQQITGNGGTLVTKIALTTPLLYYHAGVKLASEAGKEVDTRAAVGNLSRNIVIKGYHQGSEEHNANVLISSYLDYNVADPTNPEFREGIAKLNYVEIDASGQHDSSRGGLRFERPDDDNLQANTVYSTVESCVIHDSDSFGVVFDKTSLVNFNNNIVHKNWQHGIYVTESSNINLRGNLVVGTEPRPHMKTAEEKSSNFFICVTTPATCSGINFEGNYAAGADFVGIFAPAAPCSDAPAVTWGLGNYVSSSMVGWRYTKSSTDTCIKHEIPVTIFKSSMGGVMSKAGAESVTLKNLILVDNAKAISVVPGCNEDGYVEIADSVIIGRSIHSYCDSSNCGSSECTQRKGTILGGFRQADETVQLLNKVKTPLDNPKEEMAWSGSFLWNALTYVNFNPGSNCDTKDFAIFTNENIADKYTPNTFENIDLKNVDMDNSVVYFNPLPQSNIVVEKWGWFQCSAENNIIVYSKDGSLFSQSSNRLRRQAASPGIFIPPNLDKADREICGQVIDSMNAIKCDYSSTDRRYVMLTAESLDADTLERSIMPVSYTTEGANGSWTHGSFFNNTMNSFMNHAADGFYQAQERLSRFPGIIETNREYNITYTGTIPGSMRYQMTGTESDESIVITINYVRPETVRVSIGPTKGSATEVEATTGNPDVNPDNVINLYSPHGANQWYFTTNKIKFAMRGNDFVYLDVIDAIQLSMRLSVTTDEFWATTGPTSFIDRLAAVLNIPTYRIRVVDTYRGSTVVVGRILQDDQLSGSTDSSTGEKSTIVELNQIQSLLVEKAQADELNMEYPVLELNSKVVAAGATDDTTTSTDSDSTDDGTITLTFEEPDDTSIDADGQSADGSLAGAAGDGDDDEWYDPLTFDQVVAIAIAIGVAIVGISLAAIIIVKQRRAPVKINPLNSPHSPKMTGEDHIIEPEFGAAGMMKQYAGVAVHSPKDSDTGRGSETERTEQQTDRFAFAGKSGPEKIQNLEDLDIVAFETARSAWSDNKEQHIQNKKSLSPLKESRVKDAVRTPDKKKS